MALVFQYGSNCSDAQMNSLERLRGDARFIGIAQTLEDYRLTFDVWSAGRGCAASNIVPTAGSTVWGVLYDVPDWLMNRDSARKRQRRSFDSIEGEGSNYRRTQIDVRKSDAQVLTATTYVVIEPRAGLKTNLEYVGHIIRGLRERRIDTAYIETVKAIAAENNPQIADAVRQL